MDQGSPPAPAAHRQIRYLHERIAAGPGVDGGGNGLAASLTGGSGELATLRMRAGWGATILGLPRELSLRLSRKEQPWARRSEHAVEDGGMQGPVGIHP
jgi:hypothetical protein